MKYTYAKYKYSDKIKLLRMVAVVIVAISLLIIGFVRTFNNNENAGTSFKVFAGIVLVACFLLVLVVGFLEIYKQTELGKIYPIIAITLGLIFVFLVPAFETPDEQDHFGSAYNQSNVYLDYGSPYDDNVAPAGFTPYRYMRAQDASIGEANIKSRINTTNYESLLDNLRIIDEGEAAKVVAVDYSSNSKMTLYYLPALGITFARFLNLGFGFEYIFGAILNMLFYVLMTTYAIRKIPVGKRILFMVSLLPITLQQVSSYSYDCAVMACIMVVVAQAFFLKCGDTSTRHKWHWNVEIPFIRTTLTELAMYIFCGLLLSSVKSGVFLVVLLQPFVLSIKKAWFVGNAKKISIPIIVILVIGTGVFVYLRGYEMVYTFLHAVPVNVREIYGQMGVAPIEYLTNPVRFMGLIFNTLKEDLGHYIAQIGGTALGYSRIFVFKGVYIINLLMLLVSMVRYNTEDDEYKVGNRILTFIVGVIPILITAFAMLLYWTLPTDNVIMGFQGRYIVPTLAIIMLSIGRWKKIRIPNIDNLFAIGITLTSYLTCISVLSYV